MAFGHDFRVRISLRYGMMMNVISLISSWERESFSSVHYRIQSFGHFFLGFLAPSTLFHIKRDCRLGSQLQIIRFTIYPKKAQNSDICFCFFFLQFFFSAKLVVGWLVFSWFVGWRFFNSVDRVNYIEKLWVCW